MTSIPERPEETSSSDAPGSAFDTLGISARPDAGRPRRHGRLIVGALAVVWLLALGYWVKPFLEPDDYSDSGRGTPVTVRIQPGATAAQIGGTLRSRGVVATSDAFISAVERAGSTQSLRPGLFRLRKGMSGDSALRMLLDPASRLQRMVTVPEGLRLDETLALLSRRTGIPLRDFRRAAEHPADLGLPAFANGDLEGLLFPATYAVDPDDTAHSVLASMVTRFRQAQRDLHLDAAPGGPRAVLITASLAQAEGGTAADYPKIARVIRNRLALRQPLQLDTTVLYAQRRHGLHVSDGDTRTASPYNTYLRPGLPAGAIDSPGEAALRAALHPAEGDWLWFVTTDPAHRITKFTDRESDFLRFRDELHQHQH